MAPPPGEVNLASLHGVRSLANLGIMLYHAFWVWSAIVPETTLVEALRAKLWVRALLAASGGVDVFFVVTGLLAAWYLLPALSAKGSQPPLQAVLCYWRRRAAYILPPYLVLNALIWLTTRRGQGSDLIAHFAFAACPKALWANLAFLTNCQGLAICGSHLWSMAITVQFYLGFPLLLLALAPRRPAFRARLALALVAAAAGATLYRVADAHAAGERLRFPMSWSPDAGPQGMQRFLAYVPVQHFSTAGRLPTLAAGALLGLLLRDPASSSWLSRRKGLVSLVALSLQAAFVPLVFFADFVGSDPAQDWSVASSHRFASLLWNGTPSSGLLIGASLLALLIQADPLHAAAARLLSARAFTPLADLSYPMYLFHMHAMQFVVRVLPLLLGTSLQDYAQARPMQGLVALCTGTAAASYGAAALWQALERCLLRSIRRRSN